MTTMKYSIGIDVGTGSVRGALVDKTGKIWKVNTRNVQTFNSNPIFYTQSTDEIWLTCCRVIKTLVEDIDPQNVKGIGFDATCSIAVCDVNGDPVSVNPDDGDDNQSIILWMDHRATEEANLINETKHPILKYVGEQVSPEMLVPKVLWLKRNHPQSWKRAAHFFLLPDFLTWKATGDFSRSLCSVVCKCNYRASPEYSGWEKSFFEEIGLSELAEDGWRKIGSNIINPGELIGGVNEATAQQTGLLIGTPVAASMIDAYAGGLGVMGCSEESITKNFSSRVALISGTSTCHMYATTQERFVPGVWGPYYNAMIPGMWLLEGGQSATGKLIDRIVDTHPAAKLIRDKNPNMRLTEYLNKLLYKLAEECGLNSVDELTQDIHVYPDFHGNRSPLADPRLRGMILGLSLESGETDLALLYLSTVQALAYGTKQILEAIGRDSSDEKIEAVLICGGLSKNDVFVRTHANALGLPVLVPDESESVLLGSAILAAKVSHFYPDLNTAVLAMGGTAKRIKADIRVQKFHLKKYDAHIHLLESQIKIRKLMAADN